MRERFRYLNILVDSYLCGYVDRERLQRRYSKELEKQAEKLGVPKKHIVLLGNRHYLIGPVDNLYADLETTKE